MRTAIDKSGRLVLPKAARDRLGVKAGDVIDIQPTADGLHLRVVQEARRLVKDGHVLMLAGGEIERLGAEPTVTHRDEHVAELVRQAIS